MNSIKYFKRFILSFIFILLLVPIINFYMDPFSYFNDKQNTFEKNISKDLINNKSVSIKSVWQDQILKYFLLQNSNFNKNIIIGSSRSYAINSNVVKKKIMNYSLSSAGIQEIMSFIDLSLENKKIERITISIDPWIFDNSYNKLKPIFFENYTNALKKIKNKPDKIQILKNYKRKIVYILQPYVLFRSFLDIVYQITGKQLYLKSNILIGDNIAALDNHIINPDGSLIYPKKILLATESEISKSIIKEMNNYQDLKFNFSKNKINTFLNYLNYLIDNQIKIEILMIPYHPLAFEIINNRSNNFFNAESILKKELKSFKNIRIIGSFNPSKTNCKVHDFLDSHHPRLSCIKKLYAIN